MRTMSDHDREALRKAMLALRVPPNAKLSARSLTRRERFRDWWDRFEFSFVDFMIPVFLSSVFMLLVFMLITSLAYVASGQASRDKANFYQGCLQDHKRYECDVMWRVATQGRLVR